MEFYIEICGVIIRIQHRYSYIRALCAEYLIEAERPADFSISVSLEEIEAEKALSGENFPDPVYEATCLHREMVTGLVRYGVILMHSAVIAVDGQAYVFMAKSGVGKSTHIALWQKVFGARAVVVNGDKPFFTFEGDVLTVHGSPFKGKEGLGRKMSAPVAGICLLERGERNVIRPASEKEVVGKLFHQLLLPKNTAELAGFMAMLDRILKNVPFYKLQCNMDKEAALVAYEGMRKE